MRFGLRERAEQRRLPHLPRAQQEDRVAIRLQPRRQEPVIHVGKISSFLPTIKKRRPPFTHRAAGDPPMANPSRQLIADQKFNWILNITYRGS